MLIVKEAAGAHFTKSSLILISAWLSNHMQCNVWDEITYPFLNFNGGTLEA